eukprot:1027987-Amphidinium_carterae.1
MCAVPPLAKKYPEDYKESLLKSGDINACNTQCKYCPLVHDQSKASPNAGSVRDGTKIEEAS